MIILKVFLFVLIALYVSSDVSKVIGVKCHRSIILINLNDDIIVADFEFLLIGSPRGCCSLLINDPCLLALSVISVFVIVVIIGVVIGSQWHHHVVIALFFQRKGGKTGTQFEGFHVRVDDNALFVTSVDARSTTMASHKPLCCCLRRKYNRISKSNVQYNLVFCFEKKIRQIQLYS